MRGEVVELRTDRRAKGHEQRGKRYGVVVQSSVLPLSTTIIAPTSTSASPASFRPEIQLLGVTTKVLIDQVAACDASRLGEVVGYLSLDDMHIIDRALGVVLDLRLSPS
ncbi:MAG: type II toxin-antitoxin system PemK/MazF family toxin [Dermatophilus congolensis]|nr:type II toxin-antitoxin system PemK/MazF family toxin [Dermatophilus congolensis]